MHVRSSNVDPFFGGCYICCKHILFFGRHQYSNDVFIVNYIRCALGFKTLLHTTKFGYDMELHTNDVYRRLVLQVSRQAYTRRGPIEVHIVFDTNYVYVVESRGILVIGSAVCHKLFFNRRAQRRDLPLPLQHTEFRIPGNRSILQRQFHDLLRDRIHHIGSMVSLHNEFRYITAVDEYYVQVSVENYCEFFQCIQFHTI